MSTLKHIRVISRSSKLAQKQVEEVFNLFPELKYKVVLTDSFGDKHKEISLLNNKIKDIFTRELDEALLNGDADIAVHSAKDLPYPLTEGLEIIALLSASDKSDSLVSRNNLIIKALPNGAMIGTSSSLRKEELNKIRPDLQVMSIRGTIEDRIGLVDNGSIDALIVATCALKRLSLENRISEVLPFETHPLQGHLAVVAKAGNSEMENLFASKDIRKNFGTVHLVGFGPGDPELLTIKAERLLNKADEIYFDDLIDKNFLENYPAKKIYVGKRKGNHSKEQNEINKLLYEAAASGKTVIRLKGGDPMLFAHGGEEVEYLQERLINVEIVPGVSSASAAASALKIPFTHRNISSSVSFLSGHSENIQVPESGTLVYFMGASNITNIAAEAIRKGWRPETPVALVHNVSTASQKVYYSTLNELSSSNLTFPTPLIVIIGDVVNLKKKKAEQLAKPNILVTGTDASSFNHFGNIIHQPLIEITATDDLKKFRDTVDYLQEFDYIIFTSKYAVHHFFELLDHYNKGPRYLSNSKIVSIGKVTTNALKDYGVEPFIQPEDESSEGIIELFKLKGIKGSNIFIPRSEIALQILPEGLRELGNYVVTVSVYQNKIPAAVKPIDLSDIQYVAFSSPSGVENFLKVYDSIPENINFIAKGKVTLTRMIEAGIPKNSIKERIEELYPLEFEI